LLGAFPDGLTAREICDRLAVHPHRGWKFLHLLAMMGLLAEENGERGEYDAVYRLSDQSKEFFGEYGTEGYFFRDLVNYWRNVAILPTVEVLRGMVLPNAVRWPPQGKAAAEHLETWMRVTAGGAIKTLTTSGAVEGVQHLLDVGGGDGTVGRALLDYYPDLKVTVFNLPDSAYLARQFIAEWKCGDRMAVHEGDFLKDELPTGFDGVLLSRVVTDYTPKTCLMLFEKAHRALEGNGRLIINEALVDGNNDYAISWEFRYLFYDTFGRAAFKSLAVYQSLLEDAGFDVVDVSPMLDDAFYSVIQAVPKR